MSNELFKDNPFLLHYSDDNLLDINEYENTVILDFFDMIAHICYTDFFTPRDEDANNKYKLMLNIPVNNLEKFNLIKEDIERLLKYMTNGEKWTINFEKQNKVKKLMREQSCINEKIEYNSVCVLSGGLDSMAGSVLEKNKKTLFITYETNPIEVNNSNNIYENLVKNEHNKHIVVKKLYLGKEEAQIYFFKLLTSHLKETLKLLGIIKRADKFKGIMEKWRDNKLVDETLNEISNELEKPTIYKNTVNAKYLNFRNEVFHYCNEVKDFEEYKLIQSDLEKQKLNVVIEENNKGVYSHEVGVDIQTSQGIFNANTINEVNELKNKVQLILREILNDYYIEKTQ